MKRPAISRRTDRLHTPAPNARLGAVARRAGYLIEAGGAGVKSAPGFVEEANPVSMHDTLDVLPTVAAAIENLHELLQVGD